MALSCIAKSSHKELMYQVIVATERICACLMVAKCKLYRNNMSWDGKNQEKLNQGFSQANPLEKSLFRYRATNPARVLQLICEPSFIRWTWRYH